MLPHRFCAIVAGKTRIRNTRPAALVLVSLDSHLVLESVLVAAAAEWAYRAPAWAFFRVHSGVGYRLSGSRLGVEWRESHCGQ